MAKGRIAIDVERCKGCQLCITACPQDLLSMENERLNSHGYYPARFADLQGRCTGCALCAVICPDACFTVYRIVSGRMRVQTSAVV